MSTVRTERARVASREEWLESRKALLEREKRLTRERDELSRLRRELPWVKVEKEYTFDGPSGRETLSDLFGGRSQLIVQHFMLGPGWKEGCVGCSLLADNVSGTLVHLENHDVSYVLVSRAPYSEIEPFARRMGWPFKWVSSYGTDFNFDYRVSFTSEEQTAGEGVYNYRLAPVMIDELSGNSVFAKDESGDVYHTYSTYARGGDMLLGTYNLLDLTPNGRNENGPNHSLADWVRHHDRYDSGGYVAPTGRYVASETDDAKADGGGCCHGESGS